MRHLAELLDCQPPEGEHYTKIREALLPLGVHTDMVIAGRWAGRPRHRHRLVVYCHGKALQDLFKVPGDSLLG
jgi:hypothetical protein